MLSIEIENRIRQFNPWLLHPENAESLISSYIPEVYVRRHIEEGSIGTGRAMLIVGPRQSGKSTIVWHSLREFAPHILFLNMEDPLLRSGFKSPFDLIDYIKKDLSFIRTIFIDEIQHLEEAGLFVKGLVDAKLNVPVWVTGSSSFDLRSKTRESLAGRASRRRLLPFCLTEIALHEAPSNPFAEKYTSEGIFHHQLIYGSYPAVYLSANTQQKIIILNDLVDALILRDASDLFRIKRVDAFRKLLSLLAGQIGNLVNYSELASICNVDVGTINAYIEILEESHVVKKVLPFAEGKRREIKSAPKVFFIDNGIRNQLLNNFSEETKLRPDIGQLFENWVFSEIYKLLPFQSAVKCWRSKSKAEVDFVIEHSGKIYGVEAKFSSLKTAKLTRSSVSFIEAYRPKQFVVVNTGIEEAGHKGDTEILFLTPKRFVEWMETLFKG